MSRKVFAALRAARDMPWSAFIKKYGKRIGQGESRKTYVFLPDDRYVLKWEPKPHRTGFSNISEWQAWLNTAHTPELKKWLAPCVTITTDGVILVQERCERLRDHPDNKKDYPKEIPNVFVDVKRDNWGKLKGRFVCFDYPYFQLQYKIIRARWRRPPKPKK